MKQSDVKRYVNYYLALIRVKLMSMAEYRVDMFSASMGTYAFTAMMLIFINVLFSQITDIGGWNQAEVVLLFAISQYIFYTHYAFFWATYNVIPELIRTGSLDMMLLRPIHPLFQMCIARFNLVDSLPSFLLPIGLTIYASRALNLHIQLYQILLVILITLVSMTISILSHLCLALLSFWITDSKLIQKSYGELEDLRKYPLSIYPDSLKWLVLTIIPVGLVAYVPTYLLIRGWSTELVFTEVGTLCLFILLTKIVWKAGLRNYSSVSS